MIPTNINFTPKKYAGVVSLDRSPSLILQARTGWDTCPVSLCSFTRRKTSGTEVRRTRHMILSFVGFIRFIGFNFIHVQLLRLMVVMVSSHSLGHLESVKWIFLSNPSGNWVIILPEYIFLFFFQLLTAQSKIDWRSREMCEETQKWNKMLNHILFIFHDVQCGQ